MFITLNTGQVIITRVPIPDDDDDDDDDDVDTATVAYIVYQISPLLAYC